MPEDLYLSRGIVNPKYQIVRFGDDIILPDNWCSWLFNCDVRLHFRFKDFVVVEIRGQRFLQQDWKGIILPIMPGCYGEQRQIDLPQMPFYFEDRSPEGVTIRGKSGMRIFFWCQTLAFSNEGETQ